MHHDQHTGTSRQQMNKLDTKLKTIFCSGQLDCSSNGNKKQTDSVSVSMLSVTLIGINLRHIRCITTDNGWVAIRYRFLPLSDGLAFRRRVPQCYSTQQTTHRHTDGGWMDG